MDSIESGPPTRRGCVDKRRSFFIVLCCFFAVLMLDNCAIPEEPGRYYNRDFCFSIIFPDGWEIRTMENGWVILAVSDNTDVMDSWNETVTVDIYDKPDGYDLDRIFEEDRENMVMDAPDFKEHSNGREIINGEKTRWILYEFTLPEGNAIVVLDYFFVKGKYIYLLSCDSPPQDFGDFEDIFTESVRSFKFE
jgi:hypothetical protein